MATLAVFGSTVGAGLGLQSTSSNFVSDVIIMLHRSLTVGDFAELNAQGDPTQPCSVNFSVLYSTGARSMVEFIKAGIAEHWLFSP